MPYTYTFTEEADYLLCVTDGEVNDVASLISYSEAIISETKRLNRRRLLIDDRNLTVTLSPLDVTTFSNYLANANFAMLGIRIGVVYSPKNKEISHVFETALTNRSVSFQTFKDLKAAEEWLTA